MRRIIIGAILCLLTVLFNACSPGQDTSLLSAVRINEVQTSGGESDWIELYNPTDEAISLAGCFLTNDPAEPGKWQFPSITLNGGSYLILYADNDTNAPDGALHLPFRLNAGGVTIRLSDHTGTILQELEVPAGAAGLSYGCDQSADTPSMTYAWYASPTPAVNNVNGMLLGKENTVLEHGLRIKEYMSRNRSVLYDESGDYSDWIELYNFSDRDIDLCGYTLTDSRSSADKWQFPAETSIPAGGYLVVRCSGRNVLTSGGEFHTNFKLGESDSFLGLYTPNGEFCSGVNYTATEQNRSHVYTDNGYVPCRYPTPGYVNSDSLMEVSQ